MTVGWKLVRGHEGFADLASETDEMLPAANDGPLVCLDNVLAP